VPEAPSGERSTRRILWIAALLLVPLPMLRFGAVIPVARYLLLGGVTGGLIASEGTGTIPNVFFVLLMLHVLVYAALLYGAARLLARALHAAGPRLARRLALALVAAATLVALTQEIYVTPFAPVSPRASLLDVLR
jgi:hypothetical protein